MNTLLLASYCFLVHVSLTTAQQDGDFIDRIITTTKATIDLTAITRSESVGPITGHHWSVDADGCRQSQLSEMQKCQQQFDKGMSDLVKENFPQKLSGMEAFKFLPGQGNHLYGKNMPSMHRSFNETISILKNNIPQVVSLVQGLCKVEHRVVDCIDNQLSGTSCSPFVLRAHRALRYLSCNEDYVNLIRTQFSCLLSRMAPDVINGNIIKCITKASESESIGVGELQSLAAKDPPPSATRNVCKFIAAANECSINRYVEHCGGKATLSVIERTTAEAMKIMFNIDCEKIELRQLQNNVIRIAELIRNRAISQ